MPKCDQEEKQKKIVVDPYFLLTDEEVENIQLGMELRGTSFVLNFSGYVKIHQVFDPGGKEIREMIKEQVYQRFMKILKAAPPKGIDALNTLHEVEIHEQRVLNFNNGEVCFWLPEVHLSEDYALLFLKKLKYSLDREPIRIKVGEQFQTILFNGWGFRYI